MREDPMTDPWHTLTVDETLERLSSSREGLSSDEAAQRLSEHGANQLEEFYKPSKLRLFLRQFENYLIIVLIFAAAVSWIAGETTNAYAIFGIILFISIIGFFQEYRAERAMDALREMVAPEANVLRSGKMTRIPVGDLVPGDVVYLEAGDKVPADGRVIEETSLQVVESSLTGESVPEDKSVEAVAEEAPLADRTDMVYMGTIVVYGNCMAAVTATGTRTELGRISGLVQRKPEDPPIKIKFQHLAKQLAVVVLAACAIIFAVEVNRGAPVLETLIIATALAVAAIPTALPFITTITLAYGTQIMAGKNAIIRRLPAVETLGSTTVICTDKTGTLTRGEMMVRKIWTTRGVEVTGTGYDPAGSFLQEGEELNPKEDKHLCALLVAGALANNSRLEEGPDGWQVIGDPTEGALIVAASKGDLLDYVEGWYLEEVVEFPFDSEMRRMTTVHRSPDGLAVSMKGAPETVLAFCARIMRDGSEDPITSEDRLIASKAADEMAGRGLRILALAGKEMAPGEPLDREAVELDLTFLGLVGMMDPPREEAKEAIKVCEAAGIRPVMITGDHKLTASAIGRELGILNEGGRVLEGTQLDEMTPEELAEVIEEVSIFSRTTAEQKVRIVEALRKKGHIVAMTGDGVNDGPALRTADIGISMGKTGTEVSKEASDMVIADDNFATIVAAVEEGRRIYSNIRKASSYLLSCNFAEVMTIFIGVMLGLPVPLIALQILWINIVTDEFPAIGLGVEPAHSDLMKNKPRDPREPILTRGLFLYTLGISTVIFIGTLGLYANALRGGAPLEEARTTAFASLVIFEIYNAYNSRSLQTSFFKMDPRTNGKLILGLAASLGALLLAIYHPFMQRLFETTPLDAESWAAIVIAASAVVVVAEIFKWMELPERSDRTD
ncbi:cation-translocating P-type ATPase [Methanotrichaceae archaeon M04Ac]|uniref:Cation-translocating P-type ATPase n=1 Tax=Candidatus Methanocrinis alkalitolerans TaxID=3033395 RepID=A0ABT5XF61_9EURY|nr:cation-translocating P-type ATPase [Candidatus Methanocrinis alkalitolerans]MDF0593297.1 cation-translocating P-type ATPase [Candidatus Methanocrinis alkalitolerans]